MLLECLENNDLYDNIYGQFKLENDCYILHNLHYICYLNSKLNLNFSELVRIYFKVQLTPLENH